MHQKSFRFTLARAILPAAMSVAVCGQTGQPSPSTSLRILRDQPDSNAGLDLLEIAATGSGLLAGQVVDAETGQPIESAIVTLGAVGKSVDPAVLRSRMTVFLAYESARLKGDLADRNPESEIVRELPRVITDRSGRFLFPLLPAGEYRVVARRAGYLEGGTSKDELGGREGHLKLQPAQRILGLRISLSRPGAIEGVVLDADQNPVVGLPVAAFRRTIVGGYPHFEHAGLVCHTDDRGAYRLGGLSPGHYVVGVRSMKTSLASTLGSVAIPRTLLSTLISTDIDAFTLTGRAGALSGDGAFWLQEDAGGIVSEAETPLTWPTVYYPAAATPSEATPISVEAGRDRLGTDLVVDLVPSATVSGQALFRGEPAPRLAARLVVNTLGKLSAGPTSALAVTDDEGRFSFLGIPFGQYVLQTVCVPLGSRPPPGIELRFERASLEGSPATCGVSTEGVWGARPLVVDRPHIDGAVLELRASVSVDGRVSEVGRPGLPGGLRGRLQVTLQPADGQRRVYAPPVVTQDDGTFVISGLVPDRYVVQLVNAPESWQVQSVYVNGIAAENEVVEVGDTGLSKLVVHIEDRTSRLEGVAKTPDGQLSKGAAILVFPQDSRRWVDYGLSSPRLRETRSLADGAFQLRGLPPGDYLLAALASPGESQWRDPSFLTALLTTATPVLIRTGGTDRVDLVVHQQVVWAPRDDVTSTTRFTRAYPTAQPPVPDQRTNTVLEGRVVHNEDSGRPVPHARVIIRSLASPRERATLTDRFGRFAFRSLSSGHYTVVAIKPTFLAAYYGANRPGVGPGTGVTIGPDSRPSLVLRLVKGSVITGRVSDLIGAPISGASVRLTHETTTDAAIALRQRVGAVTDDRGRYRVFGLAAGRYHVSVSIPPASLSASGTRTLAPGQFESLLSTSNSASATIAYSSAFRETLTSTTLSDPQR
jgi:protocatechuate 3,4-dioxygenase beta subunit